MRPLRYWFSNAATARAVWECKGAADANACSFADLAPRVLAGLPAAPGLARLVRSPPQNVIQGGRKSTCYCRKTV